MAKSSSIYTRTEPGLKEQAEAILSYSTLSDEQFNAEIEKGFASLSAGKITSSAQVRDKMQRQYTL
jgi:hypothetical protein